MLRISRAWASAETASRLAVALAVAFVVAAAFIGTAHSSRTRAMSCTPQALTPTVNTSTHRANAWGQVGSCGSSWDYYLSLRNNAGNILSEQWGWEPSYGGTTRIEGIETPCSGAIVHSFFYINVGGTGMSDSSGTNSDCAY